MNSQGRTVSLAMIRRQAVLLAGLALGLLGAVSAFAAPLTINVVGVGPNGQPLPAAVNSYRWTVEEDTTKASVPGQAATTANYSFSFHTSYMPVVAAGRVGAAKAELNPRLADPDYARLYNQALPDLDAAKRYYVSIAAEGFQMGGAPVVFSGAGAATTATATVYVNQYALPAAQISVFAFNDNNPINGAPDLPQEDGLAGFTVQLFEAGGTYGQSGGAVTQDGFGNPLGTTYSDAGGTVLNKGNGIILTDANGVATIKNLFPAKYTVVIVPPPGSDWHQTSTIEGGKGQDAWLKNNEPTFFQEFGPPGHHVFIGFSKSGKLAGNTSAGNPCQLGTAGCTPVLSGANTVSGRIVNTHHSRPPVFTFYNRAPVGECWIGLNEPNGGRALYAAPCKKDSTFTIPNVPNGNYELVIWDEPLDIIIGTTTIAVNGSVNLGDFPVTSWFGRYQGRVFQDIDGTGLPFFHKAFNRPYIYVDPVTGLEREETKAYAAGELKPPFGEGVASNIRFRDGSIYQSTTTKKDGTFAFTEVFPFFNWMIGEIDYARFKATSATVVVDDGGCVKVNPTDCPAPAPNAAEPINAEKLWTAKPGLFGSNDPTLAYDPWIRLSPQLQETCSQAQVDANTDTNGNIIDYTKCFKAGAKYYRTEQGVILLEGMQTFLGQTNHIEWGKSPYAIDENGGIAGIVHYAITRAEDDPRYAAAENWEPGIPRVQVNLYLDCDGDGKPDKPLNNGSGLCGSGAPNLSSAGYAYDQPDVDNYPFCWRDPEFVANNSSLCPNGQAKGPEDVKRSRTGGTDFSFGDVFRWGAPGVADSTQQPEIGLGKTDAWDDSIPTACKDVTPYHVPFTGEALDCFDGLRNYNQVRPSVFDGGYAFGRVAGQAELPMLIGATGDGKYIVEAVAPPGYLHQGNGDKNVVFGDTLAASTAALPFECVGIDLPVPAFLTLFPGEANPNYTGPGQTWRKCDMKAVPLVPGTNPAPDFYMFTEAPVAGHGVGFILDDTSAEFNHFAPNFGEKYSPPHLPVSIQDWTGREISRVYSDQFGSYNFLVPSSFTINPPFPSGVMPSMMVACMNHPGPITDPNNPTKKIIDPYFNRGYSQFCYTLQYLPGKTTYLDTPVLPVAAFAAVDKNPLDCECADGTPAIYSATNADNGPWVPTGGGTLTLVSVGTTAVVNPAYDPNIDPATIPTDPRTKKTINRDYGFGSAAGTVMLGNTALTVVSWANDIIVVTVPGSASTGQLTIKRGGTSGKQSVVGLTVHVGGNAPKKVNLAGTGGAFKSIQEAIDASTTAAGDLITVAPGTYKEYVIMDKRVRLQGWGAGSTMIDAAKSSAGGLAAWRAKINARANVTFDLLAGQTVGVNVPNNEPLLFGAEEGPGILVVGKRTTNPLQALLDPCIGGNAVPLQIDGLTVTGGDAGGGVLASSYACNLQVSNNRVVSNYGTYGGGVRIGHTTLATAAVVGGVEVITYVDAVNRSPRIHHNWISQNGATEQGGGGGVTLGTGSNSYAVTDNYVCGNFSMADGGGLSHLGRSPGMAIPQIGNGYGTANLILRNKFIFNQNFNQSADPMGGGISIASQVPQGGGQYEGTGDVIVDANLIQGNQAGAGAGGGVSIVGARASTAPLGIFTDDILLTNNMIVNNVAAYTGGGVSLTGTGSGVRLINNTVASNVSTATNRQAFGTNTVAQGSNPQVAGIAAIAATSPTLLNNIVWANRSFIYLISGTTTGLFNPGTTSVTAPNPIPAYNDLGRVSGTGALTPTNSILSSSTGFTASGTNQILPATNTALFVKPDSFLSIIDPTQPVALADATVSLQSALTFDETGNFINVIFSPLTLWNAADGSLRADYHLKLGSPAIDTAAARIAPTLLNPGNRVPTTDYDADARTANNVDIGADEMPPPTADLSITKTDGVTTVNAGGALTYTIVVSNAGPLAVSGATVTDTFPASLTVNSWTCSAPVGSSCTTGGSGNSRTGTVSLPNGGSVTFTATATVSATAAGSVTNTATVAVPAGFTDPNTGNNSATDTDLIPLAKPTLALLDNFDRANANTLGANWQQLVAAANSGIRVNTNQAFCTGLLCALGAGSYWNGAAATFGAKQGAAFTFANTTLSNTGLYLKASGTFNALGFYPSAIRVRYSGTNVIVETTTNGTSFTSAGTIAATFASGDTLTAMADATGLVYVWKTSGATTTLLGTAQTTFTGTGRIGMALPSGGRVDNFAGGTVTP
jgi:large repetitive protein